MALYEPLAPPRVRIAGGARAPRLLGGGTSGRAVAIFAAVAGGLALALLFLPGIHAWTAGAPFDPTHLHNRDQ